jgi:anti-anti-sigma factor
MEEGYVRVNIETSPSMPNLKIITIDGSFDAFTSKQVDEKVLPIIEREQSNFILNLSDLIYLSSMGILRLLKYLASMTDQKRLLKLVKPPEHVYGTLVAAGIAKYFDMYDSLEAAMGSF